ncbi:hypothetical protein FGO68_gene2117 [Halteria grandinella]|uniref:Uncharacterized protein n=1 Tax=Halteria grandinella TaxID=5974 RepID=A0A8J8NUT1_HALGN|nr:hypothetical protein FGO68_gene2117 [Halteria grandinella]
MKAQTLNFSQPREKKLLATPSIYYQSTVKKSSGKIIRSTSNFRDKEKKRQVISGKKEDQKSVISSSNSNVVDIRISKARAPCLETIRISRNEAPINQLNNQLQGRFVRQMSNKDLQQNIKQDKQNNLLKEMMAQRKQQLLEESSVPKQQTHQNVCQLTEYLDIPLKFQVLSLENHISSNEQHSTSPSVMIYDDLSQHFESSHSSEDGQPHVVQVPDIIIDGGEQEHNTMTIHQLGGGITDNKVGFSIARAYLDQNIAENSSEACNFKLVRIESEDGSCTNNSETTLFVASSKEFLGSFASLASPTKEQMRSLIQSPAKIESNEPLNESCCCSDSEEFQAESSVSINANQRNLAFPTRLVDNQKKLQSYQLVNIKKLPQHVKRDTLILSDGANSVCEPYCNYGAGGLLSPNFGFQEAKTQQYLTDRKEEVSQGSRETRGVRTRLSMMNKLQASDDSCEMPYENSFRLHAPSNLSLTQRYIDRRNFQMPSLKPLSPTPTLLKTKQFYLRTFRSGNNPSQTRYSSQNSSKGTIEATQRIVMAQQSVQKSKGMLERIIGYQPVLKTRTPNTKQIDVKNYSLLMKPSKI